MTYDVHVIPGTLSWFPLLDRSNYANKTLNGMGHHRQLEREGLARPPGNGGKDLDSEDFIQPNDPRYLSAQPPCVAGDGAIPTGQSSLADDGSTGDDRRTFPLREYHALPPLDEGQSRAADETHKTKGASSSTSKGNNDISAGSGAPPLPPPVDLPKSSNEEGNIDRKGRSQDKGRMATKRPTTRDHRSRVVDRLWAHGSIDERKHV